MLSDAKIRAAKPQSKPYKLTDAKRLYLYVSPTGGKFWRWNFAYDVNRRLLPLVRIHRFPWPLRARNATRPHCNCLRVIIPPS